MLLLATQAEPQMRAHRHPNLGRLLQPRHYPRAAATARSGVPWAADNDAFNGGWDEHAERRFPRMVQALSGLPGCLFVVCPDVVGEAGLTSMLFEEYAPLLWSHGLAPAYVLQEPGVEYDRWWIPWGSLGALFIGGATNQFKLGPEVEAIVAEGSAARPLDPHGPRQQPAPRRVRRLDRLPLDRRHPIGSATAIPTSSTG